MQHINAKIYINDTHTLAVVEKKGGIYKLSGGKKGEGQVMIE